jgi:hypothetical protein
LSILGLILAPLVLLLAWRRWKTPRRGYVPHPDRTPVAAFVRVPVPLGPLDRHERLEVPLADALASFGLGEVEDGASLQADDGTLVGVTVTLRLDDPDRAIPLVLDVLRLAGVPASSTVSWTTPTGLREAAVGASA